MEKKLQWEKPLLESLGSIYTKGETGLCMPGSGANACDTGGGAGIPPP